MKLCAKRHPEPVMGEMPMISLYQALGKGVMGLQVDEKKGRASPTSALFHDGWWSRGTLRPTGSAVITGV